MARKCARIHAAVAVCLGKLARRRRFDGTERWKSVGFAKKRGARDARVLVYPPNQRLHALEDALRPDPRNESDIERRSVEIAGKIEQVDFEQYQARIEHRSPA